MLKNLLRKGLLSSKCNQRKCNQFSLRNKLTTPIVGQVFGDLNKGDRNDALRDLEILTSMEETLTVEITGLDGTGTDDENLLLMDTLDDNEGKYEPDEERN